LVRLPRARFRAATRRAYNAGYGRLFYFPNKLRPLNFPGFGGLDGAEVIALRQNSGTMGRLLGTCWAALVELRGHVTFLKKNILYLFGTTFDKNILVSASRFHRLVFKESIVAMIIGHLETVRVMNHPVTLPLIKRYPDLVTKYLGNYLALSFSKNRRREILRFHYRYLTQHVCASFHEQILDTGSVLWSETNGENN
jgi:hypothetical protein